MNSITYISMGVNYDEAKAFVNEIQRQIKKYCRIIKKVKKEDKNKIYFAIKDGEEYKEIIDENKLNRMIKENYKVKNNADIID